MVRLFIYPRPKGLVWHQFAKRIDGIARWAYGITACRVSPFPFVLDSIQCSALIPCSLKRGSMPQQVADSIHGSAVIWYDKTETGSYIEARIQPCFFSLSKLICSPKVVKMAKNVKNDKNAKKFTNIFRYLLTFVKVYVKIKLKYL